MTPKALYARGRWPYLADQGLSSLSTFLLGVVVIAHGTHAAIGRYAIGAVEYQILITCGRSIALTPLYLNWGSHTQRRRLTKSLRSSLLTSGLGIAGLCVLGSAVPSAWPGWALVLGLPAILTYDCGRQLLLVHRCPGLSVGPATLVAGSAAFALAFSERGQSAADSAWWSLAITSLVAGTAVWLLLILRVRDTESSVLPEARPASATTTLLSALQSLSEGLAAPVALLVVLASLAGRYGQGGLHGLRVVQTLMAPLNPLLLMVSQHQWRSLVSSQDSGADKGSSLRTSSAIRRSQKMAVAAAGAVGLIGVAVVAGLDLWASESLALLCFAWTLYVAAVAAEEALLPPLKVLVRPGAVTGWRIAIASAQVAFVLGVDLTSAARTIGLTGVIAFFAVIQIAGSGIHLLVSTRARPNCGTTYGRIGRSGSLATSSTSSA